MDLPPAPDILVVVLQHILKMENFPALTKEPIITFFFLNTAGGGNDLKLSGSDKITINANGEISVF